MSGLERVIVEADGGSRGNPGPASYGALVRDAASGDVLAEDGTPIGIATNNVAEYSGLIAGLRLAAEVAPGAAIEVRMDSKLVVEQMSGRWQVKHPGMKPLFAEARLLAPEGTTYVWVPREQNKHADRLANEALDGIRHGATITSRSEDESSLIASVESVKGEVPARGWGAPGAATTLILLRHGVTPHTAEKRFSGGLASANPPLSDDGRAQIRAAAEWLLPIKDRIAGIVSSPVRRTRESAEIAAGVLGKEVAEEHGFAEMEFGEWDGLTFAEVGERFPGELERWLGSLDEAPRGGESLRAAEKRVLAGLDRVLDRFHGQTVLVVSHVTPIKALVARALESELDAVYRMELAPASISVITFYDDGNDGSTRGSLRLFNALPPSRDPILTVSTW
ncbi:bifunctional RNase H/acid phosphatase [Nocardioides nematodiphilus]|uniref:bifunctional RNase H/acid phosphatase n=1 Tax=Nocardioides nematodiphilus TaxID=2849669 RepID=UPI001CD98CC3|nr:bifunctional RNase H/acid phosphatase [Nocardioides nematodiphilus]MCA1982281.1 bifunctional RNase H/acid phosphatase [Nocardioides nematodiphilus]